MRKAVLFTSAAAVAAVSTAVTAQYRPRTIDPRYVAEAQRQHPQVVAEFGGAETGPRAGYVNAVGQRVAAQSGLHNPGGAFRFTVLNSAVQNAFTVPGGYVYITRQLMTLMDDESELAFALGHEAAHIAANHAQQREAAARRNSMGALAAQILGSVIGGSFGSAIAQRSQIGAKLQTLSFSREQEYQSDSLGIRYLVGAGYDPAGAPGILAAIGRATALEARVQGQSNRQLPEWASTHPLNQNRIQRTRTEARATGRLGTGLRNRDQFLAQLDGVYVDDDPEQGIIDGRTFSHPDLGMQFTVPVGYLMQNGTREVSIKGSAGQAEFSGGRYNGTLESYVSGVLGEFTRQQLHPAQIQRRMINGIPGRGHHASRAVALGRRRCQHRRLPMGAGHGLSFRAADAGRQGPRAVLVDGELDPQADPGRGRANPAANHRRRHGPAGRHRPVAIGADGLSRFPERAVPGAQRACPGRAAAARPEGQAGRLRGPPALGRRPQLASATAVASSVHMPPAPPPSADSPPIMASTISAAINPYSTAVAPRWSACSLHKIVRTASTPSSSGPRPRLRN